VAAGAVSENLVDMTDDLEMILLGHFLLKPFNLVFFKFDNLAAFETNQVVVMAGGLLKTGVSVAKLPLMGQPRLLEKLQSPVDGHITDLGIHFFDLVQQLLDGQMAARPGENLQDDVSFLGLPNPLFGKRTFQRFESETQNSPFSSSQDLLREVQERNTSSFFPLDFRDLGFRWRRRRRRRR
jgi:hypothetical protein